MDLLRERSEDEARVAPAELFFDLVFVFAVTQLSHSLLAHLTPLGVLETGMLFLGIWWMWIFTVWATNWLDPETTPVRLLLFALMAAGLFVTMAIPEAFGRRGLVFATAFAAIQVGRSLFMLAVLWRRRPENFRNFQRITIWLAGAGAFWITGGLAEGTGRLLLWGLALALEYVSPAIGFAVPGLGRSSTRDWDVEGHHIAERCGLFIIIALGESILMTGASFAAVEWNRATLAAFAAALLGTIAMWWLYFNISADRAARLAQHAEDPGRIARLIYTYIHLPIVGGIIVSAVADEIVLGHPLQRAGIGPAAVVVGGTALFLAGSMLFRRALWGVWPVPYLAGMAGLAVLALAAPHLTLVALGLLTSATLVVVAVWSAIHLKRVAEEGPEQD